MGWILLCLGIALWYGAHLLRRVAPDLRARLGDASDPKDKSKGIMAAVIFATIALMVIGFRMTPYVHVYVPPSWGIHANNLLVLLAIYLFGVSGMQTRLARKIRHPMLAGMGLWAFAHLLVNGDLASVILFGGLWIWAILEVYLINAQTVWEKPEPGPMRKEFTSVAATLVLFGVITSIHSWLGYYPFPG